VTANFAFVWDIKSLKLRVVKRLFDELDEKVDSDRQLKKKMSKQLNWKNISWNKGSTRGCGATITWSAMAPVPVPLEFQVVDISTDDVPLLEKKHIPKYEQHFNLCMEKIKKMALIG